MLCRLIQEKQVHVNSTQTETIDMDLLLLYEPAKLHYVVIIDLLKFICEIKGCKYRPIARLCRNCVHVSWSDETHEQHIQCCKDHPVLYSPEQHIQCCKDHPVLYFFLKFEPHFFSKQKKTLFCPKIFSNKKNRIKDKME